MMIKKATERQIDDTSAALIGLRRLFFSMFF
jgi:hypothetical protein